MKKQIPTLVSLGFALLLFLGLATSLFLLLELSNAVKEAKAIDATAYTLRASVRSLGAHYLEMGRDVSTQLLDPGATSDAQYAIKLQADKDADKALTSALETTRSEPLRQTLLALQIQDHSVTDPLEDEVLRVARTDLRAAREIYLNRYLPAQSENIRLVENAVQLAITEISDLRARSEGEAMSAQHFSWLAILVFLGVGLGAAGFLTRAVAKLVRQADEAARINREVMDQSLDIICSIDGAGRFIKVSAACERIWGYKPEELLGRGYIELVHPDDLARTNAIATEIVAGRGGGNFENRYLRKDGGVVHIMWSAHWSAERQTFFCVAHDPTDRRRAEDELRTSELRFRSVTQSIGDAIISSNPAGEIIFWNAAAEKIFGHREDEVIGEPLTMIMPERFHAAHNAGMKRYQAGGEAQVVGKTVELIGLTKEGREFPIELSLSTWNAGPKTFYTGIIRDIAERKHAAEALRKEQEFLAVLFENVADGIIACDAHGVITLLNRATRELHGLPMEPVPSEQWSEHFAMYLSDGQTPMTREQTPLFRALTEGVVRDVELVIKPKDARPRRVMASGQAFCDAQGARAGAVIAVHDITERRRAEDELRESQLQLELALQASNIGPWDWDLRTNQVFFSPEWKGQLGYAEDEIGTDISEFSSRLHPEDVERITSAVQNYIADPTLGYEVEFQMRHKDGSYRWIHTRGMLHFDEAGRPVRMLGCHLDVTERRRTQKELKEAKVAAALREGAQRYSFLADTVPQVIWTARPDGGVDYYNKAWFNYTGLTLEQTKDWGWAAVVHPDDLAQCVEKWTHSFTTGEEYGCEYRFKSGADGTYRWHFGRALPMRDEQGQIVQWVGTCTDIHDAKRTKEILQAANDELGLRVLRRTSELLVAKEVAEAANRTKSEFLANMSHEIRTPMNGIIGMTDLTLDTDLNREQREYLGMVKTSAHGLLGLINDILDFSKIEAGKLELEVIDFSLRDCVASVLKPLGIRADQKGLELAADISADVPDQMVGDPMRLRQILINLTDNAIKFTQRGEVIVKVINQSPANGEGHLQFSVSDTGIGIPQAKQASIFEAFAQVDGTTSRTYGGTGLGLSIASQLIQKMRGRIWIESEPGKGTTFHFTARLPLQGKSAQIAGRIRPRQLEGLRALVVDDNAANRRILQEMLTNWHMQPTAVASGMAALEEMQRAAEAHRPFAVVLMDEAMPEMNGFALAARIRENAVFSTATTMMLSSTVVGDVETRCRESGVSSFLTKPVTQSHLLDAILLAVSDENEAAIASEPALSAALETPAVKGLRILLAEDNVINRAVATGILEKQGHRLTHAANGQEAVTAIAGMEFDLIFMDIQMPGMDGFEATRLIRETEAARGGHMPIVAMTAHAMAGDRERCLAGGMDGYISKPLSKAKLLEAVTEFGAAVDVSTAESVRESQPMYGAEELLEELGDDAELVQRVIAILREKTPQVIATLHQAVAAGDAKTLCRTAHTLVGSLGAVGAFRAVAHSRDLETAGESGDFASAAGVLSALEDETDAILRELDARGPVPVLSAA